MPTPAPAAALSGFELFWARYPNKFGRSQAQAAWHELDPSTSDQEAILRTLAIEASSDFRVLMAGGAVRTPTAAVWLYSREFRRNAPGRALAEWRIALESHQPSSPRAALALHAVLWMAGIACAVGLAAAPSLFDRNEQLSVAVVDAIADAHRIARYDRVVP